MAWPYWDWNRSNSERRRAFPSSWRCRSSQVESTGTNVLDKRYEETIAKPTASESGTKSACAAPCMKNEGRKTARMHSMASRRGTAVSMLPRRTAEAIDRVFSIL